MLSKLMQNGFPQPKDIPKEGDLYKVVNTFGRTFEIRYGYYGECDRNNPLLKGPVPIYPDLLKEPVYTDEGEPLVTMMQDACESYCGNAKRTPDTTCEDCKYFNRGEEWFGVCKHPKNKRANE